MEKVFWLKKLVGKVRWPKQVFCIIDAQSVKNTDTAEEKGYDAGKKISGIKRHIAVDTQGLPHAIYITRANIWDRNAAIEMVCRAKKIFPKCGVNAGYTGEILGLLISVDRYIMDFLHNSFYQLKVVNSSN